MPGLATSRLQQRGIWPELKRDPILERTEIAMDAHTYPVTRTDAEWRARLTPEQYYIMRQHGTERPGSCALLHEKRAGTFKCAG